MYALAKCGTISIFHGQLHWQNSLKSHFSSVSNGAVRMNPCCSAADFLSFHPILVCVCLSMCVPLSITIPGNF